MKKFGMLLRMYLEKNGTFADAHTKLNGAAFAKYLGVHRAMVQKYFAGLKFPGPKTLKKILAVVNDKQHWKLWEAFKESKMQKYQNKLLEKIREGL